MGYKNFLIALLLCILMCIMQFSAFAAESDDSGNCQNGVCTLSDHQSEKDCAADQTQE